MASYLERGVKKGNGMIQKRYTDTEKLMTKMDDLVLTKHGEVCIYSGDQWYTDVFVDLDGKPEQFEELKPMILYAAKNLCNMDLIAQKYCALEGERNFVFEYEVAYILLNAPDEIILGYYGMQVNTEFDVVFQCVEDGFLLKRFGTVTEVPPDWDKE